MADDDLEAAAQALAEAFGPEAEARAAALLGDIFPAPDLPARAAAARLITEIRRLEAASDGARLRAAFALHNDPRLLRRRPPA